MAQAAARSGAGAALLALALVLWAGVGAAAPGQSIRPVPRPAAEALPASAVSDATAAVTAPQRASTPLALYPSLRPQARPEGLGGRSLAVVAAPAPVPAPGRRPSRGAALHSPHEPAATPAAVVRPAPGLSRPARGQICGVAGIEGEILAPIAGRVQGCGLQAPVRVTSVNGVRLSQGAIMDCETARALDTWVRRGLKPAFGATGGGVTGLQIAGHYVCRTRNHRAGARISEHGKGRAVDISGIHLANGTKLSILRDWRGRQGAPIRAAHKAACGIFGTTLGPGSDGMHEDHLHFDTARHRNGAYCR